MHDLAELDRLDTVGTTGLRTFAYVLVMPFACAAIIAGGFNLVANLAVHNGHVAAWHIIALAIGVPAIVLARRIKRGAGAFKSVLATRAQDVRVLKLLDNKVGGAGMGASVGYAWLYDANKKILAMMLVNNTQDLALVKRVVQAAVPGVNVLETNDVTTAVVV